MKLDVFSGPEILVDLASEWTKLLSQLPGHTIFATPEWAQTWWQAWGEGRELCLMTLRDEAGLAAIVPLFIEKEGTRSLVRFLGGVDVTDYEDIVARPGLEREVWAQALDYLSGKPWDLDLHNIPGASSTISYFRELGDKAPYSISVAVEDVCPVIAPLPKDWDAYLENLDKKDRHELKRKLRRLMSDDDVSAELSWRQDDLNQAMIDFVRLHKLSSTDKNEFMTPRMVGFFNSLAAMCKERGWLCLAFLAVQGVRASTFMAFEYGDGFYLYNSGYDPQYEYTSAGLLLKALSIQHAIETGKTCYDFLQGNERYKYDLGGKDTQVYQITGVHR